MSRTLSALNSIWPGHLLSGSMSACLSLLLSSLAVVTLLLAGQTPEPVASGQDRIEVVSPAGVSTAEGGAAAALVGACLSGWLSL